jgi:hypothetical protein
MVTFAFGKATGKRQPLYESPGRAFPSAKANVLGLSRV